MSRSGEKINKSTCDELQDYFQGGIS
ncbi:uncharacterized protein METZ01_LOCUS33114 [marine metagenome]|uniref:Uncharacterized protein n=1 Tax=marine metagenome TaxID=408172 RepID=A0A381QMJ2_9ZZZZ